MTEENKLTEEEERLLKEFEEERRRRKKELEDEVHQELKDVLAEQVKDVMEKEMVDGIEAQVQKEVEMAMNIEVEKAISIEEMKKKIEDEIRRKIEQETRERLQKEIEEKIRREVEEREKQRKSEVIKKIKALSLYEEELRKQRENEEKEKEQLINKIKEAEKSLQESLEQKEKELREKLKEELRKELEEERQKKKEALLQKLNASTSSNISDTEKILNHNEKIIMLQLFEESQFVLSTLLSTRLNKKDVESVFSKTINVVADNYPEILRRSMYDKNGNPLPSGVLNISRIIANVELINIGENKSLEESKIAEEKITLRFLEALKTLFSERLRSIEKITNSEIKNKLFFDVINQMKKSIMKKGYSAKITEMFFNQVFPDNKT
ncbi:MAG: hypothetical protein N3E50_03165 [Candidatus Goldbacteria bacterium]|nr:hypothetical protein [Candidatus Goldiibacteriota bacterium]